MRRCAGCEEKHPEHGSACFDPNLAAAAWMRCLDALVAHIWVGAERSIEAAYATDPVTVAHGYTGWPCCVLCSLSQRLHS